MNPNTSRRPARTAQSSKWWIVIGVFFVTLAIYVLFSPGRIDTIDGQARYDVAYNWLLQGRPLFLDPFIVPFNGVHGRDGLTYSFYGPAASVASMPLVCAGIFMDGPTHEASRFLFSLTSCIFGAAIASVLFLFYLELGLTIRAALAWTMVNGFATLIWVFSTSTFEHAQHAFFIIAAVYLGLMSAKRDSKVLAAMSGLLAGVLILYQEYFIIILPIIAISTLKWSSIEGVPSSQKPAATPRSRWLGFISVLSADLRSQADLLRSALRGGKEARASCARFLCFLAAISADLALYFAYNSVRFGSFFDNGKHPPAYPPMLGNPLAGFLTIIFSPGKSIFLYSPPLILGILGIRYLRRRRPELAFAIIAASLVLVAFVSCFSFAGGDWCWGPRYLVPLLPLWALAFPFTMLDGKIRRDVVMAIVGVGLIVQVLALSVDNFRFFFDRGLQDFFWAEDPWFYFKHSALFARVSETISLSNGLPQTAHLFSTIPYPGWTTYTILGPPPGIRHLGAQWMSNFMVYYLPKPWPVWMQFIRPVLRPVSMQAWLLGLFGMLSIGAIFIYRGLRLRTGEPISKPVEMELEPSQL